MTFRGFLLRLTVILMLTWIIGSFTFEWGWALYLAALPIIFYEMLRQR